MKNIKVVKNRTKLVKQLSNKKNIDILEKQGGLSKVSLKYQSNSNSKEVSPNTRKTKQNISVIQVGSNGSTQRLIRHNINTETSSTFVSSRQEPLSMFSSVTKVDNMRTPVPQQSDRRGYNSQEQLAPHSKLP